MPEFLKRLFASDFMPHGRCWGWDPWVVWSNVISDSLIFLCYSVIGTSLIGLALKRRDRLATAVLVLFGMFIFTCGCTHAMEVYNTWHGAFPLAGLLKALTAAVSALALIPLLGILPKLAAAPSLGQALSMHAALSTEKQAKRRVEGELLASQDRFRLLVESIKDYAIFLQDPDGRITSWNPGAERIKGYAAEEILGQPYACFYQQADVAAGMPERLLEQAASLGRSEEEGLRIRKDGSGYIAHVVVTALHDHEGRLRGFANVTRDITEQKSHQSALRRLADNLGDQVRSQWDELRENEARLQGFIRHASAAIAFKALDGRFLLINPKMAALLGRPEEAIIGRTSEDLFPAEGWARSRIQDEQVLHGRQDLQVEEHWIREDGAAFDLLIHKFPLVDATNRCWGLGLIATDITGRKQAELALLQSQKLESLGVLAGGIAHDFNNLLGAMQGNVELAMGETAMAGATPYLRTLRELMGKGAGLLRQLLAYSGGGSLCVRTLDLNQLVAEMTHLLESAISKKASIRLELRPELPSIEADPSQIQQVVMNLVINASEAFGERSGVITVATGTEQLSQAGIEAGYDGQPLRPGLHVSLEVADTGPGMSPEVLKKIFDPFFSTKFTGRGLGLAAIQGIVRRHRGGVQVRSESGHGSVFKFLFPAAGSAAPAAAEAPPEPAAPPMGAGTILVVDDEDAMRTVVAMALERQGFQALQARDGLEGLELYRRNQDRIRLIVLDLTMPRMDGEEACRELRRRGATVPVILTTGFDPHDALGGFEGLGLAGALQKPFPLEMLVTMVTRLLAPP